MPVVDPLKESLLHATCVVVGTKGVLLLGESGSGKSTLALSLMAWAQQRDMWTALVGDDRLFVHYSNGRLVARSHPKIAHLIECRYLGILSSPFSSPLQEEAQIHLCVDLKSSDSDAACSRLPAHEEFLLQNEKEEILC